ncbi:MAG TPA: NADPH:quinone reductase [Micromonosporaceae bacterium]
MRAAYLTGLGSPEVIRVGDLPVPVPGPTDVLVRVEAVAVNPVDALIRAGRFRTPLPMPFVVGRDLVGTVERVGGDVDQSSEATRFTPGDPVWCNSLGHAGRQGATAEFAVVPVDRLYPLPPGVDPAAAVAVLHPAATAWLALVRHARLRPGERLLVQGAGGNVGRALVELGAQMGGYVCATAAPADHDAVRRLGARDVLDYRAADLDDQAPGSFDVAVDCSGRNDLAALAGHLALGARVVLLADRGDPIRVVARDLYTRDVSVLGFAITNASVADLAGAARWINDRLAVGGLPPRALHPVPLEQTAQAHHCIEAGVVGRLVILP